MSESRTDFVPLAPVRLVRPNGQVRSFGLGAASDSARGTALVDALEAWSSGDAIKLGPGTFEGQASASPTLTVTDGESIVIRGAGIDRTIIKKASGTNPSLLRIFGAAQAVLRDMSCQGSYAVIVDSLTGRVETNNLGIISSGFDIDNGTGEVVMRGGYSTGGWPVTGCIVDVYGMTISHSVETLSLANNTTDPSSNPTRVRLHGCKVVATSNTSIKFSSSDVELDLYDCILESAGSEEINDDNGNVIRINAGTVYTASKIVNSTITRLNQYGIAITAAGLALLDDANAAAQRATLGANKKVIQFQVFAPTADVVTGDGAAYFHVPAALNGGVITAAHAAVIAPGITGTTDVQIANIRSGTPVDVLSTKLTIDSGETGSDTAAAPAVINAENDDLATNDRLRVDVDAVSTTAPTGLIVTLEVTF